jgi:RimJ/RimL family protein N-acetyltransferase
MADHSNEQNDMNVRPVTLAGTIVRLDPLTLGHVAALARVGLDPELWRLQPAPIASIDDMHGYVSKALDEQHQGTGLPFAIIDRKSEQVIGSTRFMDIAPQHRRLEIGGTWLAASHQRTGANTEAKLLLLTHAFETLGAIRVVFKTELLNQQSRNALARIGAVEEGVFRKHLIAVSGRARDMVYFSILDTEWPTVKAGLVDRSR